MGFGFEWLVGHRSLALLEDELQPLGHILLPDALVGLCVEVLLERIRVVDLAHLLLHCLFRHDWAPLGLVRVKAEGGGGGGGEGER